MDWWTPQWHSLPHLCIASYGKNHFTNGWWAAYVTSYSDQYTRPFFFVMFWSLFCHKLQSCVIVIALSQFYVHPSQLWVKVINVVHYGQQLGLEFWVGTKCGAGQDWRQVQNAGVWDPFHGLSSLPKIRGTGSSLAGLHGIRGTRDDAASSLLLVCVSFTIIGQPWNSVLIRRV